jgi:hypothetical protein
MGTTGATDWNGWIARPSKLGWGKVISAEGAREDSDECRWNVKFHHSGDVPVKEIVEIAAAETEKHASVR